MAERNTRNKSNTKKPDAAEKQSEARKGLSRPAYAIIALVAVAFLIYSMVSIIKTKTQIRELEKELKDIEQQSEVMELKIENEKELYDSIGSDFSTLAEQIARDDLGYIREGERVFVNVAGD